jgi:hypothetical protein
MPLPVGLPSKTLTFGRYLSPLGNYRAGSVQVGFDNPMLYLPTGEVITSGLEAVAIQSATGNVQIEVPITDTDDLVTIPDGAVNQRIRVAVTIPGYPTAHHYLDIHADDPSVLDFDQLIPYGSAGGIPVLRASVTSVAGLTGIVGASELADAIAPFLPAGGGGQAQNIVVAGTAATALSGHRAVTRLEDGTFGYASNDNIDHLGLPLWVTTGASSMGAAVQAVALGEIIEPSWSWSLGPVFLGANGLLTQSVPTAPAQFLAQVGFATGATRMFVDRQPSIMLI